MKTTTKKVRSIMRAYDALGIYTNKTFGDTSDYRRVKCYFRGNDWLLEELRRVAGHENVKLTKGSNNWDSYGPGIVVKCFLS
jgi:hypothetical protein